MYNSLRGAFFLFFKTTKNKNIQTLKYRNTQEVMIFF